MKSLKKILIGLVVIFILIGTATLTLGKYVYNSVWNYYLSSKGFYFESNLLDVNTRKNSNLKWDGSDVYFKIKNSQNEELISEYNISYKVMCTVLGEQAEYIKCDLNGTGSSSFVGSLATTSKCVNTKDEREVDAMLKKDCELNGYTWKDEISSKDIYFNLSLTDSTKSINEVSVEITAESLTPYSKLLKGIFNLNRVDVIELDLVTNYQSYVEYDELSITNTTENDKCVVVDFDSKNYLLDLEENSVSSYETDIEKNINQINIKLSKNQSKIYKFYKINNNKVYSKDDFVVTEVEC